MELEVMELRENEQRLYGKSSLELMQAQPKQNLLSAWTVHLTDWTNKAPYFVYAKLLLDFPQWHRIQINRIYFGTIDAANNIKYFV